VKFTGQVRIPEVDHPGVPATIVVEGDQTEVFLEGETLGRWSLFDVHASRLVSSAFSLSLGAEEITFIADEPVDFAYKGVDHMAEAWARFKSMSLPRRMIAVGRSRRGTVSSRISELREAMLSNLESVGRPAARLVPIESVGQVTPEPASWTKRIGAYSTVPEPLDDEEAGVKPRRAAATFAPKVEVVSADDQIAAIFEPAPLIDDDAPALTIDVEPIEGRAPGSGTPRLRPGPGLIPRPASTPADDLEVFAPPPARGPLADSPWDEPPMDAEPPHDDMPSDGSEEYYEDDTPVEAPEPAPATGMEPGVEPVDGPGPEEQPAVAAMDADEESEPPLGREEGGKHEVVVDLGHLESDDEEQGGGDDIESPEDPGSRLKEPVLAGAPVTPPERSGLLGAVRSAFARNRVAHEHEFVEAPGGIGIVRQICAECGYISIGVTD